MSGLGNSRSSWLTVSAAGFAKKPLLFEETEVEHVIPDSFGRDPDKLSEAIRYHELENDFDLQSFENLRPAHSICNKKRGAREVLSLSVNLELKDGKKNARRAEKFFNDGSNERVISLAEGLIGLAEEHGFSGEAISLLEGFVKICRDALNPLRSKENRSKPVPWISGQLVQGPYGQGLFIGSDDPRFSPCPVCGVDLRNGIRCAWCGNVDD